MFENLENYNQADVNRLSAEEYQKYEQSAKEKGFVYYYGGQQMGPEAANYRFFGTHKARIMFDASSSSWSLSPVLVWPEWDLKPLLMNEVGFRGVMSQYGVPKSVLDDLVGEKFPPGFFEI